jgi:hypothetical protein
MEDLKDRSAYQFHHAQDNESILKSYKTSEWEYNEYLIRLFLTFNFFLFRVLYI